MWFFLFGFQIYNIVFLVFPYTWTFGVQMSLRDLGRWIWDPTADDDLLLSCVPLYFCYCMSVWLGPSDGRSDGYASFSVVFSCIVTCVVIISSLCEPLDRRSNGLLCLPCLLFIIQVFLKPLDLWWTAVMSLFLIKSGPPDSSDGPDLICLSQTHWPIFLNRFDPSRAQYSEPTRFFCLSPIFSTVLLNTPLFSIITPFSLCFLSFKNIFALY